MKGNVNPFEPWRPVEAQIPQPLHASRPWRPPPPPPARPAVEEPPFVEPVKPEPRNKAPERPKQPQRRTGQPSAPNKPDAPRQRRGDALVLAFMFLLLFLLPFVWGLLICHPKWLGETHYSRVVVTLSAIAVSIWAARRRDWYTRLSWMAAGLALAGLSAWFVPTLRGVSLWSAYRQIQELRALPAGDVAEYQRGVADRRTLIEEFPSFAADVRAAEQAWFRRTVDEAIEKADRQLDTDPQTAFADLHRLKEKLARVEHSATVEKELKELEAARLRAMQASAKVVQREVNGGQVGRR